MSCRPTQRYIAVPSQRVPVWRNWSLHSYEKTVQRGSGLHRRLGWGSTLQRYHYITTCYYASLYYHTQVWLCLWDLFWWKNSVVRATLVHPLFAHMPGNWAMLLFCPCVSWLTGSWRQEGGRHFSPAYQILAWSSTNDEVQHHHPIHCHPTSNPKWNLIFQLQKCLYIFFHQRE